MRQLTRIFDRRTTALLAILTGVGLLAVVCVVRQRRYSDCLNNLRIIQSGLMAAAWEHGYLPGESLPLEEFCEYAKGYTVPQCKSGGWYVFHEVGRNPTCSIHGDLLMQDDKRRIEQLMASGPKWRACAVADDGAFYLDFTGCSIRDLSPLECIRLRGLCLDRTTVQSIEPLAKMGMQQLKTLSLRETGISDLSPVSGLPLETLKIDGTSVTDLSPLTGMRLHHLWFSPEKIRNGLDLLSAMDSLRTINGLRVRRTNGISAETGSGVSTSDKSAP